MLKFSIQILYFSNNSQIVYGLIKRIGYFLFNKYKWLRLAFIVEKTQQDNPTITKADMNQKDDPEIVVATENQMPSLELEENAPKDK